MAIDTAQAIAQLNGLTAKFDFRMQQAEIFYPEICTIVPSNRHAENYGWLGAMPGMVEWLGERQMQQLLAYRYWLENLHWEQSIAIERTSIDDDHLGLYGPSFEQAGLEAAQHPDELVFDALVAGSDAPCFDGQYFFDTDHVAGSSGSQSNLLSPTAANASAPTVAEFQAAFSAAVVQMFSLRNDKGKLFHRPVLRKASDLMLLVPNTMLENARIAMLAVQISATTNVLIGQADVVGSPFLTDASSFYLFRTNQILKAFVFQRRQELRRQMKGITDFEFKEVKFLADARYNVGYLAWWNCVKSTFTT